MQLNTYSRFLCNPIPEYKLSEREIKIDSIYIQASKLLLYPLSFTEHQAKSEFK